MTLHFNHPTASRVVCFLLAIETIHRYMEKHTGILTDFEYYISHFFAKNFTLFSCLNHQNTFFIILCMEKGIQLQ